MSPLRVIALVDYDAFYAQCESVRLGLSESRPLAVRQWNAIIALNYPARKSGLKRGVSVDEAKRMCPDIVLQHVPTRREGDTSWAYREDVTGHLKTDKAALDFYRLESRKSLALVKNMLPPPPVQRIEKASVDEFFLDLSAQVHGILLERYPELMTSIEKLDQKLLLPSSTHLDWQHDNIIELNTMGDDWDDPDWDDIALNIGTEIIRNIREQIYKQLKYTCSAGIARNKTLAKLAAGHKKPNQQTVVRNRAIPHFLSSHRLTSIRGLGGKLGAKAFEAFGTEQISDFLQISAKDVIRKLGSDSGMWLFNVIRGSETSEVTPRTQIQTMLSAKTFSPSISGSDQAAKWLRIFAADLISRIEELAEESEHRRPRTIALHHHINGRFGPTRSKQASIPAGSQMNEQTLFSLSKDLLKKISSDGPTWPCASLSVSVSDFKDCLSENHKITSFVAVEVKPSARKHAQHDPPAESSSARHPPFKRRGFLTPTDFVTASGAVAEDAADKDDEDLDDQDVKWYCCPKCGKDFSTSDVLEHLDWHFAVDLHASNPLSP